MIDNLVQLKLFAHHKGGGSTTNGRNSAGRRLGTKRADGQHCLLYTSDAADDQSTV